MGRIKILQEELINLGHEFIEAKVGCVVGTLVGHNSCGVVFIEDY